MLIFLYVVYVIVCFFLIAVVLLQSGKGADLASAFGGGGSQAAIGARGAASALSKMTTYAAVAFMVLSLALSIMKSRDVSVLDSTQSKPAPQIPAATSPSDSDADVGGDPMPDAPAAEESGADAAPPAEDGDAGMEAGTEAGTDVMPEAAADAQPEAAADAEPLESGPESETPPDGTLSESPEDADEGEEAPE